MNERPVRKKTARNKDAREDYGPPYEGDDSAPEHTEQPEIRPEQPTTSTSLPVTDNGSMEGIHTPDALGSPPGLPLLAQNGNPDPITDSQTLEAVKFLAEKLAAQERALANVIAELQARNGIASNGGTQSRGTLQSIIDAIGQIGNAVAVGMAKSQPSAEATLTSRLLDMTLNHYAVIDQVYLKTAGLPALPVKPNHVVMTS